MTQTLRGLAMMTAVLGTMLSTGCAVKHVNPSFAISIDDARADLDRMADAPRAIDRPVVVLGGWMDSGVTGRWLLIRRLDAALDSEVLPIGFVFGWTFDGCRQRVLDTVAERFGEDAEVDVVAFSMGGLVARYAATNTGDGRRLNIQRLITISTPHRGAQTAVVPTAQPLVRDMRADSDFLAALPEPDYPVVAYGRLRDFTVGLPQTRPEDRIAGLDHVQWWWIDAPPGQLPHGQAPADPRLTADLLRRLRNEPPLATQPSSPPPDA